MSMKMASPSVFALLVLAVLLVLAEAKIVTHDFNLTWVTANPDGLQERKVIGINNQWPLPVIEVDKGDRLVVNVFNGLGDKSASMHFHGMFQNGTNEMDGANMVTQCPITPGTSFTYNFTVTQNGTYWYHCHTDFCYPDGYRQALIVHDENAWWKNDVKDEFTFTISDWYHKMTEGISSDFLSIFNPTGAEPIPDAFLFNDTLNSKIAVEPNSTYLLRIINTGAFTAQYFYIEDHDFQIVEVDGVYTEPTKADLLYIGVAQRYAILVTTKNTTDKNFAIVTACDSVLLDKIPSNLQLNLTNWLSYNPSAPYTQADVTLDVTDTNPAFDDFSLVPYDKTPLLGEPNKVINLTVSMGLLSDGLPYAFFNDITYTMAKVPSMFTALSAGELTTNSQVYGDGVNPFVLDHNDIIEVVINNNDGGSHPFHLHGHNFQVIARFPSYGPDFYEYANEATGLLFDPSNHSIYPAYPIRRDVVVLPPMGYMVIRFVADNPGVWLFHCHIDWHMSQGLASVFVEAPTQMQQRLNVPADHYAACKAANVPSAGNAAGNTANYLDLSGEPVQSGPIPYGKFTTKGIVALVFSILSAIMGMVALTIYGLSDVKYVKPTPVKSAVEESDEHVNIVQTAEK
ncbi:multicopper oxidase [Myriangium duriaei CBS 260.36]|uniref:Multicopper oxidase n=1 Tax=Myriangium duriaei CBS 260.36 TaxID=1168546 RepID=A0A9P4MJD1_9PEZI|nr:multicopper oxidase [Myriangium duriaei CBS 260.36]